MLDRLKNNTAFMYVVLPIIFLLAMFASVYAISAYWVYLDKVAYGDPYEPPKELVNINELIIQRQLAEAKARNAKTANVEQAKTKIKTVAADESLYQLIVADLDEPSPDTDPFGNPRNAPDPCKGHLNMPDFTSGDWPSVCTDHQVPAEHCADWLEREWSIGNDTLHEDFRLPTGCLP